MNNSLCDLFQGSYVVVWYEGRNAYLDDSSVLVIIIS